MSADQVHGLLTPDNCAVIFIDHQPQMLFGVNSMDRQLLINNTVGLAKAAKIFKVPVTWLQVLLELQRDWARKESYDAVIEVVKEHAGACGSGVEYAYTMVHGQPASSRGHTR